MTVHGWVEGDNGKISFPKLPGTFICWNVEIEEWCDRHLIQVEYVDPLWTYAFLTKRQVLDFISDAYGAEIRGRGRDNPADLAWPMEVDSLRMQVQQELSDGRLYKLSGYDY